MNTSLHLDQLNSSWNLSDEYDREQERVPEGTDNAVDMTVKLIEWYYMPTVVILGLIGNCLSLVVFMVTYLNRLSLSVYLAALAISDSGFLMATVVTWIRLSPGQMLFNKEGWCQLAVFITYVFSFLSSWLVVSFSVERYIAICHPFLRPEMCTVSRARKVVSGLTISALLLFGCSLWITGTEISTKDGKQYCTPLVKYYTIHKILIYTDVIVTLFIPFLAVLAFNIKIAHTIAYFYHNNAMDRSLSPDAHVVAYKEKHVIVHHFNKTSLGCHAQIKITRLILIVSSIFLILSLPSYIVRLHVFFIDFTDPHRAPSRNEQTVQKLCQFLFYHNFAINFVVYSLCSKKFRDALCRMLWQARYKIASLVDRRRSRNKQASSSPETSHEPMPATV